MKFMRSVLVAIVAFASLQAFAQRQAVPIVNYDNLPVAATSGKPLSAEQVKKAIQDAAVGKGWTIAEPSPGKLLATLSVRNKHLVVTEIQFSPTQYSLTYKDSTNMKYSPEPSGPGAIHPFYNRWVGGLKDAIRLELVKL